MKKISLIVLTVILNMALFCCPIHACAHGAAVLVRHSGNNALPELLRAPRQRRPASQLGIISRPRAASEPLARTRRIAQFRTI